MRGAIEFNLYSRNWNLLKNQRRVILALSSLVTLLVRSPLCGRKKMLTELGLKAMIAGTIVSLISASIAGIIIG